MLTTMQISSNLAALLARWAELRPREMKWFPKGPRIYHEHARIVGGLHAGTYIPTSGAGPGYEAAAILMAYALDCIEQDWWLPRLDCIGRGLYSASALGPKGQAVTLPGVRPVTSRAEAAVALRIAVLAATQAQAHQAMNDT